MKKLGWYRDAITGNAVRVWTGEAGILYVTGIGYYTPAEFVKIFTKLPWYKQLWYSFLEE